jgi:hypothetical protein
LVRSDGEFDPDLHLMSAMAQHPRWSSFYPASIRADGAIRAAGVVIGAMERLPHAPHSQIAAVMRWFARARPGHQQHIQVILGSLRMAVRFTVAFM